MTAATPADEPISSTRMEELIEELSRLVDDVAAEVVATREDPDHVPSTEHAARLVQAGAKWPARIPADFVDRVGALQRRMAAAVAELHTAMVETKVELDTLDDRSQQLRREGRAHRSYRESAAATEAAARRGRRHGT